MLIKAGMGNHANVPFGFSQTYIFADRHIDGEHPHYAAIFVDANRNECSRSDAK
jgi:hypothetical protein